jgi:hypothetical protein
MTLDEIAKILLYLAVVMFIIKIYYHIKITNRDKNSSSIIVKMILKSYGGMVILPIFKEPYNEKEKKLIKKANIFIYLFYAFTIIGFSLIYLKYGH